MREQRPGRVNLVYVSNLRVIRTLVSCAHGQCCRLQMACVQDKTRDPARSQKRKKMT